jgi:hypothetical protein
MKNTVPKTPHNEALSGPNNSPGIPYSGGHFSSVLLTAPKGLRVTDQPGYLILQWFKINIRLGFGQLVQLQSAPAIREFYA